MSISVFDIRTGNHLYKEGQVYEVHNGPGVGDWYTLRKGEEVRILWKGYLNHPLHNKKIKNHLKSVLDSGALDYENKGAAEKLRELYAWVLEEVRKEVGGDS